MSRPVRILLSDQAQAQAQAQLGSDIAEVMGARSFELVTIESAVADMFLDNLRRWRDGEAMRNAIA